MPMKCALSYAQKKNSVANVVYILTEELVNPVVTYMEMGPKPQMSCLNRPDLADLRVII